MTREMIRLLSRGHWRSFAFLQGDGILVVDVRREAQLGVA